MNGIPRSGALGIVAVLLAGFALASSSCGSSVKSSVKLRWSDDEPSWSPDARRVVFVSNRANPDESTYAVYVMKADGSGVRRVTDDAGSDASPSFSPNGRRIAYLGHADDVASVEVDVIGSDGSGERRLAADPTIYAYIIGPAWSPDGRLIAFIKTTSVSDPSARDDLWVVPAGGGRPRRVAKAVDSFAWSHDGRRIAFGCFAGDVCVVSARGGALHRQTHVGGGVFEGTSSVAWSPDDRQIAFVQGTGGSYQPDYYAFVINADGTGKHRFPRFNEGSVDDVLWLPRHARTLLVETDVGFYVVRRDGTDRHALQFVGGNPALFPDGKKLLFVQAVDRGGDPYYSAIYFTSIDGGSVRPLTQTRR